MPKPLYPFTLALDLGVSSCGYAIVRTEGEDDQKKPVEILKMGVRIYPLSTDDVTEFTQGNAISKNAARTTARTARKGLDRYQLRRKALWNILEALEMHPDKNLLLKQSPLEIWGIRAKAVNEKITLKQLGRILLHLNQKRGYKHSKADDSGDSKQTDYVQKVNERYAEIKKLGMTVGQFFYEKLRLHFASENKIENAAYRIKEEVFPREAYIEEFDKIWNRQAKEYPDLLTDELRQKIRNEIIYYQRRLKSQKGLVNICEF
jgi:CRISPR-associated endonuclease Csn1